VVICDGSWQRRVGWATSTSVHLGWQRRWTHKWQQQQVVKVLLLHLLNGLFSRTTWV